MKSEFQSQLNNGHDEERDDLKEQEKLIFIVDDEPGIRTSLGRYFESKGFRVQLVEDGYDVLVLLEELRPDLIISDIRMPKCDGITLLQGMKNRLETKDIPVIFMTGYAEDHIMEKSVKLGANYFLAKPFPLECLDELVYKVLSLASKK